MMMMPLTFFGASLLLLLLLLGTAAVAARRAPEEQQEGEGEGGREVTVSAPSKGLPVLAGRTFSVEWAGILRDESKVEIDLFHCGTDCDDPDWCGDWVIALCDYGGHHSSAAAAAAAGTNGTATNTATGCSAQHEDNNNDNGNGNGSNEGEGRGEYDVIFPEPHTAYNEDSQHKVRVRSAANHRNWGCSGAFSLLPSEDAPQYGGEGGGGWGGLDGGPFLEVISPMTNDTAIAGEEYTVEFAYDNGLGSSADRFKIDLYSRADDVVVGGGGGGGNDCGKWITSICDKHSIGCKDSAGDYDVVIPRGTPPGPYSIRVGRFEDDSLFDCSGIFRVVRRSPEYRHDSDDEDDYDRRDDGGDGADSDDDGDDDAGDDARDDSSSGDSGDDYGNEPMSFEFTFSFDGDGDDSLDDTGGGGGGRGGGGRGGGGGGGKSYSFSYKFVQAANQ